MIARRLLARLSGAALLAAAALFVPGCDLTDESGSYHRYTMGDATPAKVATLGDGSIELAEGAVVAVTIKAFDADDKEIGEVSVTSDADDPMGAASSRTANVFVFYGRRAGSGSVAIAVDGTNVATITTTVK